MLKVRRIIDDLIFRLEFQNKSEIAVSDRLSSFVSGLSESETESKQKNQEKLGPISLLVYLLSDGYQYKNLKNPI